MKRIKDFSDSIELINDEYILSIFISKNNHYYMKNENEFLITHPNIANYIKNRFKDSLSTQETVYRIFHKLEIRPVCKTCGKPVKFVLFCCGFQQHCCVKCIRNDKNVINKANKTLQQKPPKSEEEKQKIINKVKQTKLLRYGNENYNNFNQAKQTYIKRYGGIGWQSDKVKEKYVKTCYDRYNVSNGGCSQGAIEKIKNSWNEKTPEEINQIIKKQQTTCILKYGETSYTKTKEYRQFVSNMVSCNEYQIYQTYIKKLNGTINSSKIEQQFKEYLEQNYPNDFEYQYRSELYPFNCDFYIKSLDLYIEIQGNWTHGGHPFNENNQDDIDRLNEMKNKNTNYYNNAIQTWTIRDIEKRNIAKQNNLNYLEIFSNNINNVIKAFNDFICH